VTLIGSEKSATRPVTLAKVAEVAGVATSTVSHVLNNRTDCSISVQTRNRVREVARLMGYRPNVAARALRGGATHTLGVIDSTLEIEVVAMRWSSFEDVARRSAYVTSMSFNREESSEQEDRLIQSFRARSIDGIVIVPALHGPNTELRKLIQEGFPVVTLHGSPSLGAVCDVSFDYALGGRMQGEHLVKVGRRRVCQVTRGGMYPSVVDRLSGLRGALEDAACPPCITALLRADAPHYHRADDQDYHDLRRFFREQRGRFDAIVGTNDEYALCAMRAALDEGIRVPDDVAVVGFDGVSASRMAAVPMTTVIHPTDEIAVKAFEILSELISARRKPGDALRVVLAPKLVARQSTLGESAAGQSDHLN